MDKEWSEKNIESPRNSPPEKEFPKDSGSFGRENRRRPEDSGRKQVVEKKRNERFIRIFKGNKLH